MKTKRLVLLLFVCVFAVAMYAADNPNMGAWKLNDAKSKFGPGATKNSTVIYTANGDDVKVTTDGMDGNNKPVHTEWIGKFDGKDYPVTGGESGATRSYKVINERKMELTGKTGDKVTNHGTIEVAKDGKTRTVHIETTSADGKKIKSKAVYDKQ